MSSKRFRSTLRLGSSNNEPALEQLILNNWSRALNMSKYTRYQLKQVVKEIRLRLSSQSDGGGSLSYDLGCMANGPDLPVRYVRQLQALLAHPDCILINDLFDLLPKMRKAEAIEKEKRLALEADLQRRRRESQAEENRRIRETENRQRACPTTSWTNSGAPLLSWTTLKRKFFSNTVESGTVFSQRRSTKLRFAKAVASL